MGRMKIQYYKIIGKKGERERGTTELTKGERNFSAKERSKEHGGKLEKIIKRTELVLEEEKDWEQRG